MATSMKAVAALLGLVIGIAGPADEARAVEIQRVVSPRGIEAWLVEDGSIPLIAMSFAFLGGAAQDPIGKPGVANLVSGLLDEGAGNLDSRAFQTELDDFSIEMSFGTGYDSFSGSLRTLAENRDQATRLLRLALSEPRFDSEPFERVKAQVISGLRGDERNPRDIASNALMRAAFPDHAYGRPVEGTLQTVAAITVADLKVFHRQTFARDNLKIAVVGAIDAATLGTVLDEIFGGLPVKANRAGIAEPAPLAGARIDVAMAIPQTVIGFAAPGLIRGDPEFIPAYVATFILGGGGSGSRLYDEIRERRGLAYSISLGLRPFDYGGIVTGGTSTRSDQADTVVSLIEEEIRRFADEGPSEEELAKAKAYLIGSYPLRFTTSTRIARQLLAIQLDDLGIDYVDRRDELIAAVTIDDVRRAAARLFGGDDLIVVRVGEPAS